MNVWHGTFRSLVSTFPTSIENNTVLVMYFGAVLLFQWTLSNLYWILCENLFQFWCSSFDVHKLVLHHPFTVLLQVCWVKTTCFLFTPDVYDTRRQWNNESSDSRLLVGLQNKGWYKNRNNPKICKWSHSTFEGWPNLVYFKNLSIWCAKFKQYVN